MLPVVIQEWHRSVTVCGKGGRNWGKDTVLQKTAFTGTVWAKSSSKVPQKFTFCQNRHRKHGASGGQRFGESSVYPKILDTADTQRRYLAGGDDAADCLRYAVATKICTVT